MTTNELTHRFIEDIKSSLLIRQTTNDPMAIIGQLKTGLNPDIRNFHSSINVIRFNDHLGNVTQFINFYDRLVDHDKNAELNLEAFCEEVISNQNQIEDTFQKIIDNPNLIAGFENQKLSELLLEELDYLHHCSK